MITSILMIYGIIMCWWYRSWIRRNTWFSFINYKEFYLNVCGVSFFVVFFLIFIRLLNVFRERKTIDLNKFYTIALDHMWYLVLIILLLYSLRSLLIYFFKTRWFRLHYFLMSPYNFPKMSKWYSACYLNFCYKPLMFLYKYLKLLNLYCTLVLILVIFMDLIWNDCILDISLLYLRYYSIYKLIYLLSGFVFQKQNLILDYYNYNIIYSGTIDKNPFHTIMDNKHRNIIGEAMNYKDGIIMESIKYAPKKIDYIDNDYYRYINIHSIESIKIMPFDDLNEKILKNNKRKSNL